MHYSFSSPPHHYLKHFFSKDSTSIITTKEQYFSGSYFCFDQQCFNIEAKVCDPKIEGEGEGEESSDVSLPHVSPLYVSGRDIAEGDRIET